MGSVAGYFPLNNQRDFSTTYNQSQKWYNEVCIVFYRQNEEKKLAVVASKKVGKAVKRNRIKRILRSAFANCANELKNGIYIIVAKTNVDNFTFEKVERNMRWSFKKMGCLK